MAQYPYQPYRYDLEYDDPPRSGLAAWLIRLPMLLITGAILLAFVWIAMVMVHQTQFNGLIFPGVSAYGVQLGGLSRQEALDAIQKRYTYGAQAVFTFRDGAHSWQMKAADLGVSYDPRTTVEEAYAVGRSGGLVRGLLDQWAAWTSGRAVQPQIVYDQSRAAQFLNGLAGQINQPMRDATILLNGTTVSTTPSQVGRTLDMEATLGLLRQVILNMSTGAEIPLIIHEVKPQLLSSEDAAAKVRAAVSSAIQLYIDAPKAEAGPWQITPEFISGLIRITRIQDSETAAHYDVSANVTPLRTVIQNLASTLKVDPVSARFIFNAQTRQLEPIKDSVNGRSLNVDGTLKRIEDMLFNPANRRVPVAFIEEVPPVNSRATAADLGITQEIVRATTFFYGSSPERKTNIQVAASRFHGLVISPGEVFSFNNYLGDVSPETGYETGLVIVGNQTIKGVGGGVCQVSSTAFQAAFFAGFPINERYAHGYRVGYYESGVATVDGVSTKTGLGMDATVYGPIVDLKFTNDTPYYLLIETYFDAAQQSLTFKFYSTPTGRSVTKDGPVTANPVGHGPAIYEETSDLAPGQSRQVDYAVDGLDVTVYRTITRNGQVISSKEQFFSHYLPWQARFQVGKRS